MIVNTNEVIYDDGRESSIIHFSNNLIHATIHILVGSHRIIFSWVLIYQKKKDVIKWKFFVQLSNSHAFDRSKTLLLEKKGKIFTQNVTLFEERARASEYTYTQK